MEQYEPTSKELTPEESKHLDKKNFSITLLLVTLVTLILFMDKATIGYTTILGIYKDTNLTKKGFQQFKFNFYAGYLIAQWPCHILMQNSQLVNIYQFQSFMGCYTWWYCCL